MILRLNNKLKKKSVFDEVIALSKMNLEKQLENMILMDKELIKYFELFPYGKELKQSFELLTLRIGEHFTNANEWYKTSVLKRFMTHFYETLLISIDKELKLSNDFSFRDVKNAFYKTENLIELKKALSIFNCKTQSQYYEFSKNGVIELYTQLEYLRLSNFLKLRYKDAEAQKPKTTSLKNESESIKIYREIISRTLKGKLAGIKFSVGREDMTLPHIFDIAEEKKQDYEQLKNRYYTWTQRNPVRYRKLIEAELKIILSNKHQ